MSKISECQQPVRLFDSASSDAPPTWDAAVVARALMQQRDIPADAAHRIGLEVEQVLAHRSPESLTPQVIGLLIEEQLRANGLACPPVLSENAVRVLERRYLKRDEEGRVLERPGDMFERVARVIAEAELGFDPAADIQALSERFYALLTSLEFLPNSPTLMNAGRELGQLSACFVLPIGDSMEDIFEAVKYTAMIHKSGGGTGFSFSRLRPREDVVQSTKGVSSGPVSFMRVFDTATETIKQGGTRRGANMGILRIDHPDILDFIACKTEERSLNNFNISVAITEAFMSALQADAEYDLVNPRTGKPVWKLEARKVFEAIVRLSWRNGEPGIIFIDRMNKDNPTPALGPIESTNPCGEQPLLPYESCNLGSLNVGRFARDGRVDYDRLSQAVRTAVHFLDNVIEVNRYPLPEIERMTKGNRKIGLGVMGFADLLIQLGVPYMSEEALRLAEDVMGFIQREAREASADLAERRGAFPNFPGSVYDRPGQRPLRNATTTTIAPTGTISIIAGCSSGIEPLFGVAFVRNVMDRDELFEVHPEFLAVAKREGFYSDELLREIARVGTPSAVEAVPERVRRLFQCSHDITPEWHVRTQAAFQKYTDNAVSKTVNLPHQASEDDVAEVFRLAYLLGCKGVTVYRDGSRSEQVLNHEKVNRKEGAAESGPGHLVPRERPEQLRGSTMKMSTGCGNLYVTINEDDTGIFELFTTMGKAGGCASSQAEAISRLISLALRAGVDAEAIIRQLSGVRCPSPVWRNGEMVLSCADAIARVLRAYADEWNAKTHGTAGATDAAAQPAAKPAAAPESAQGAEVLTCPDCGSAIHKAEGCMICRQCGFSRCA